MACRRAACPAEPHLAWTEALFDTIRPQTAGVYSNFLADEGGLKLRLELRGRPDGLF